MKKGDNEKERPLFKGKCIDCSCAWWVKESNGCAVVGLAQAFDYQARIMRDILSYISTPESLKHL